MKRIAWIYCIGPRFTATSANTASENLPVLFFKINRDEPGLARSILLCKGRAPALLLVIRIEEQRRRSGALPGAKAAPRERRPPKSTAAPQERRPPRSKSSAAGAAPSQEHSSAAGAAPSQEHSSAAGAAPSQEQKQRRGSGALPRAQQRRRSGALPRATAAPRERCPPRSNISAAGAVPSENCRSVEARSVRVR